MKMLARIAALLLMLTLTVPALAATPTPAPIVITGEVQTPPAEIQAVLDIAYNEWATLAGQTLSNCNKFTEWRGKGVKFGWCAGYVTWCMIEAGIPMEEIEPIIDKAKKSEDTLYHTSGAYHVMEASVGKVLRGYQAMGRATNVPQPGFLVVYGCSYNKTIHLGLVYDVVALGNGKYRITTLEGNMSSRVKMYIRDYDMNAEVNTNRKGSTNLTEIPMEDRVLPESDHVDYSVPKAKPSSGANGKYAYYVNRFLMPWVPGDPALNFTVQATVAPTAEPTIAPTATPTVPPAAEPTPTAEPAPTPAVTEAPAATEVPATEIPLPEATPAGDPTYPCKGQDGKCPYVTRSADDPFCRTCDRNDNGVEDTRE